MKMIAEMSSLFLAVGLTLPLPPMSVSAIDAKGVRYVMRTDRGRAAWFRDIIFAPRPGYPVEDRRLHHEGIVVIRLDIDLKTGNATYFTILKSSGFPNIDEVAVRALAKWRFKPGRWKQVDIPIVFTFHTPGELLDYSGPGHP